MTGSNDDEFDPTTPEQREVGREMVDESTGLGSVMAHAYRVSQSADAVSVDGGIQN